MDINFLYILKLFDGRNLLAIESPSHSKYITNMMRVLFSEQERKRGIILTKKSKRNGNKERLDKERVKLLKCRS